MYNGSRANAMEPAKASLKTPPPMRSGSSYDDWKKEIQVWKLLTDLEKEKQGPALLLSLSGKARDAALELDIVDISTAIGLEIIIDRLDKLFLVDRDKLAFAAYEKFESYTRSSDLPIESYIADFDHLYNNVKKFGMTLPEGVLAFRLLKSANLTQDEEKLARATVARLTYNEMSISLKKIAGQIGLEQRKPNIVVKEEAFACSSKGSENDEQEAFYNRWRGGGYRGRGYRGRNNRPQSAGKRKLNPLDKFGKVSRCSVCGSKFHWVAACPDKDKEEADEDVKITLMTGDAENAGLEDTLGCAVLDSACTKTVCGSDWLKCYVTSLSEEDKSQIVETESTSTFRFGDGKRYCSLKRLKLPCRIFSRQVFIETDVVSCKIPLLLSKISMKKAGMKIDFATDAVTIFGQTLIPTSNAAGHYVIPLCPEVNDVLISLDDETSKDRMKVAEKLHKQFAHASSGRLIDLLRKAGKLDTDLPGMLETIEKKCETCLKYKKPNPRPVVGLPIATRFNETVALDLKSVDRVQFLHMIDVASRYSAAIVVDSKKPDTIIAGIFHKWISVFGPPKNLLTDNGGEFVNEKFVSMAENFNIRIKTTAGESPWSNGVVERHNGILGDSIKKIMADAECDFGIALDWAIASKNSLQNHHGFAPNQIVFGSNPCYPNVETNEVPALESITVSEIVAGNLSAMHSARKEFIKNESCEKLRRALLKNTRNNSDPVGPGDDVFYKRMNSAEWRGPGRVIGQDGQQILVKHGGLYVRVHPSRIRLAHSSQEMLSAIPANEPPSSKHADEIDDEMPLDLAEDDQNGSTRIGPAECNDTGSNESDLDRKDNITQRNETHPFDESGTDNSTRRPTKGQRIQFRCDSDSELATVEVLGRAGKVTGRNRHCFNIKYPDGTARWIDLSKVMDYREIEDDEEIFIADIGTWDDAKDREMKLWKENDVYTEVQNSGQRALSCRWVITEKIVNGEKVTKARLVARGFEEQLEERTDSPTCSKENFRLALAILSMRNWELKSMDIKAAFLQGDQICREVYLIPPPEAETENLWKLNKTIYGLNDAARAWYLSLKTILESLGARNSGIDNGLFTWCDQSGELAGIICVHVDDLCFGGTEEFKMNVISEICQRLSISKTESLCFKYLGLSLCQNHTAIFLEQDHYLQEIDEIPIKDKRKDRPLSQKEQTEFRSIIGAINWLSSQTRPDAAFESCILSTSTKHPCVSDLLAANRVIRKLKDDKGGILIDLNGFDRENACLEVYADASFGNLQDGSSQGGYVIFLSDGTRRCIVAWQSKKLRRVVKSTFAAETMAMIEGSEAGIYLAKVLKDSFGLAPRVLCFSDNASLIGAVGATTSLTDKRLRIDIAILREMVKNGEIHLSWVPSHEQLADCFTKRVACKDKMCAYLHL